MIAGKTYLLCYLAYWFDDFFKNWYHNLMLCELFLVYEIFIYGRILFRVYFSIVLHILCYTAASKLKSIELFIWYFVYGYVM